MTQVNISWISNIEYNSIPFFTVISSSIKERLDGNKEFSYFGLVEESNEKSEKSEDFSLLSEYSSLTETSTDRENEGYKTLDDFINDISFVEAVFKLPLSSNISTSLSNVSTSSDVF